MFSITVGTIVILTIVHSRLLQIVYKIINAYYRMGSFYMCKDNGKVYNYIQKASTGTLV